MSFRAQSRNLFLISIYILGVIYLLAPHPTVAPSLSDLQSDEPGDTWQNPNQKAFFTNKNRSQVLLELQDKYSLDLFGIRYKGFRLNYRPEEAGYLVRDQIMTYYLEEIIHPFRESTFVNGWDPTRLKLPIININGKEFLYKVTLRPINSHPLARVIVWTLIFPAIFLIYKDYQYIKNV